MTAEPILSEGTTVGGRWRIAEMLGEGGFGQVFRAEDKSEISLGQAAIKVLHMNTSPLERKVFAAEVQRMAVLRHPNLVGYLDSGQMEFEDGLHSYLVAEYCKGSLDSFMQSQTAGVLSRQDLLNVLQDVAYGLAHLHRKRMLHRDIKPPNVLYNEGAWKLGDFGLTRELTATGSYHRDEVISGTPAYMAPELFTTKATSTASDIYAVGVLAHVCATRQGLHGGTGQGLVHRIMSTPPKLTHGLDPEISDIVYRCSMVEPDERISASELHRLILRYQSGTRAPERQPEDFAAPANQQETTQFLEDQHSEQAQTLRSAGPEPLERGSAKQRDLETIRIHADQASATTERDEYRR